MVSLLAYGKRVGALDVQNIVVLGESVIGWEPYAVGNHERSCGSQSGGAVHIETGDGDVTRRVVRKALAVAGLHILTNDDDVMRWVLEVLMEDDGRRWCNVGCWHHCASGITLVPPPEPTMLSPPLARSGRDSSSEDAHGDASRRPSSSQRVRFYEDGRAGNGMDRGAVGVMVYARTLKQLLDRADKRDVNHVFCEMMVLMGDDDARSSASEGSGHCEKGAIHRLVDSLDPSMVIHECGGVIMALLNLIAAATATADEIEQGQCFSERTPSDLCHALLIDQLHFVQRTRRSYASSWTRRVAA